MRAWRGYNNVISSITEFVGVVKSFAEKFDDNLGTPVEVSCAAPENSLALFYEFFFRKSIDSRNTHVYNICIF